MEQNESECKFNFNERIIWDSGFGYEIGLFLSKESNVYNSYLVDLFTGVINEVASKPKNEIFKYSNELIDKLTLKYGTEKRFSDIF